MSKKLLAILMAAIVSFTLATSVSAEENVLVPGSTGEIHAQGDLCAQDGDSGAGLMSPASSPLSPAECAKAGHPLSHYVSTSYLTAIASPMYCYERYAFDKYSCDCGAKTGEIKCLIDSREHTMYTFWDNNTKTYKTECSYCAWPS